MVIKDSKTSLVDKQSSLDIAKCGLAIGVLAGSSLLLPACNPPLPSCEGVPPSALVGDGRISGYDGLMAHDGKVFWLHSPRNASSYELLTRPDEGGSVSVLARGENRAALLHANASGLFWLEYTAEDIQHRHEIKRLAPGRDTPELLAKEPELTSYALHRDHVYFHFDGEMFSSRLGRVPVEGGDVEVVNTDLPYPNGLVADDDYLYLRAGYEPSPLWKLSVSTLEATQLIPPVNTTVYPLKVDDAWLYWTEEIGFEGEDGSQVRRIPKAGGAAETLAESDVPTGIEVDETHVYFSASRSLLRFDKETGELACVAAAEAGVQEFAVGRHHVYWADRNGSIWQAPK